MQSTVQGCEALFFMFICFLSVTKFKRIAASSHSLRHVKLTASQNRLAFGRWGTRLTVEGRSYRSYERQKTGESFCDCAGTASVSEQEVVDSS